MFETFEKFTESEKDQFAKVVNTLLSRTFIVSYNVDPKNYSVVLNKDFHFAVLHQDLIRDYLKMSGWELQIDDIYGYCAVYNQQGSLRKSIGKIATIVLYILRIIYEEEREKLQLSNHVTTSVGKIKEMLEIFKLYGKKLKKGHLNEALQTLKFYHLIERLDGSNVEEDSRIIILPTVLHLINNNKIQAL